jgi:glycosyltransferase involved in cell wall biosynthesis
MDEMTAYTEQMLVFDALANSDGREQNKGRALTILKRKINGMKNFSKKVTEMKSSFLQLMSEKNFDVILFHGKSVFAVIEDWNEVPIVIDFCDATSMRIKMHLRFTNGLKRVALLWRYQQMKKTEKRLLRKTPHLSFISCRDRDAVLGTKNHDVKIVPIGVDHRFWARKTNRTRSNCIVFTGIMNYRPNEDAALYLIEEILPIVRRLVPDFEVFIVGRNPQSKLIEKAKKYKDIKVTGFVDDVRTYLERAAIFIAPLRYASGVQNKVLEALAMEVPVVCTSIVADGLRFDDHENPPVQVADGAEVFAKSIANLLSREDEQARLAVEGRRFVQNHFVWSKNAEQLERLCLKAVREQLPERTISKDSR